MANRKGIQLSINFLVTLIIAIVVFGMGIYLATMIFGGGGDVAEKKFEDFDRQVGELSCYAADNVCVHKKSVTIRRGNFRSLAVTIKNALKEEKQFKLIVSNTKMIDSAGETSTDDFDKLKLFGLEEGRIELMDRGEKKTLGAGVEVPEEAPAGTYTLSVMVEYADAEAEPDSDSWTEYTDRPYKIFIDVP
ncbi:MAG: hypothetical protein R6U32_03920 [Candidatus Woesearchaeota archaeon]